MKAYINNIDWADEGDIFFFSIESEENLQLMKELIKVLEKLDLFDNEIGMYWGTNESFSFNSADFIRFIEGAEDISEEELAVFNKFKVSGFDIYERILDGLQGLIYYWEYPGRYVVPDNLTQEGLDKIKPLYIKLYGQESWNKVQQGFNEKES